MVKKITIILFSIILTFSMYSCANEKNDTLNENETLETTPEISETSDTETDTHESDYNYSGQIFLFGEQHGVKAIIDKEYELWHDFYHQDDMRHLFIELSYCSTEFLNLWMKADDDQILDQLFIDKTNTSASHPDYKVFYQKIKSECPETIFHGTDVGHHYNSTGKRYLEYLENQNLKESQQYKTAKDVIEQGELYSSSRSATYRENKMVENFIREIETLTNEPIMGIYGADHTELDGLMKGGKLASMANQLNEIYVDQISSESLVYMAKDIEPERIDQIEVAGKTYDASYFGKHDLDWSNEYQYREFWRLEDAYADFMDYYLRENVLPDSNYPMNITDEEVFVIDYTLTDGSVQRQYYRIDGYYWQGMLTSVEVLFDTIDKLSEPLSMDTIDINGKSYEASYYGKYTFDDTYKYKEIDYWRLEGAYEDYKDLETNEFGFIIGNLPFEVEKGQVFILDITLHDGTSNRWYARYDGIYNDSNFILVGFTPK